MVAAYNVVKSKTGPVFIFLALFFPCPGAGFCAGPRDEVDAGGNGAALDAPAALAKVNSPIRLSPGGAASPKLAPIVRGPLRSGAGRYRAAFSNGKVAQGARVMGWGRVESRPTLNGVWLFDPANPVSWLRDDGAGPVDRSGPYVEFAGGDRLPCKFSGYRSGLENPGALQLPHILVQPSVGMHKPGYRGSREVRVLTRWLRRIVMSSRSGHLLSPGTVFYAAGGSERFRSMRWSRSGVRLLLDSGLRRVPFTAIAELHLPARDPWDAYFEQLAVLLPGGAGRLRKVETTDGVVLTASDQRFREGQIGNPGNSRQWWHVFQPAWSLDALWLKYSSIISRSYNLPAEVPLSVFHPTSVKQKAILGGAKRWRSDSSVLGRSLACAGAEFMRGFGVRAFCELEFTLSDCVKFFRTGIGIDMRAGKGGCALGRVFLREYPSLKETRLYSSDVLIGSDRFFDSGNIPLDGASLGDGVKLVLLADPAVDRTPPGADPLDIRDLVNWVEPRLSLDPATLRREVSLRSARFIPSLKGWSQVSAGKDGIVLVNSWDESNPGDPGFRLQLAVSPGGLRLSRRVKPTADNRFLSICARLLPGVEANCQLKLLVGGVERTRFAIPQTAAAGTQSTPPVGLVFDLAPHAGTETGIELQFSTNRASTPVEISGLAFNSSRLGLREIYEQDPRISSLLTDGDGFVREEWRDSYSGNSSLRVSGGQRENVMIEGMDIPIRSLPVFGEYRYLRFAWKKKGGEGIFMQLGHDRLFGPEPGPRSPSFNLFQGSFAEGQAPLDGEFLHLPSRVAPAKTPPSAPRVFLVPNPDAPPPAAPAPGPPPHGSPVEWTEHTVDLASSFGRFNLTGFSFGSPDGEYALFDHIWLARTLSDLDGRHLVKTTPHASPSWKRAMARKGLETGVLSAQEQKKLVNEVASGFELSVAGGLFGEGASSLASYRGRPGVLRTHPGSPSEPVRLVRKFPRGKKIPGKLRLSVAHDYRGDWQLQVLANGESLADLPVGPGASADGWVDLVLDLSGFNGEDLVLEILNKANGWSYEYAYWWLVSVED